MADFNQNFVTNNVTVESDEVIKFINPFKNHQQHQIEDFSLFFSSSKKCRCCFSKFINESDQHTVESWHRQAFLALTGVEMITQDSENFLCLKCAEILKIYTELGKSAANLQRKYNILMQDLASDIKNERAETDEISSQKEDYNCYSDILKSDYEIISYDNEQSQQTNSSDRMQNGTIHDEDNMNIEEFHSFESSARVKKCTVRLTRIDPETIDKDESYSIVETTGQQIIDHLSSSSGKDSETNAHLKITYKNQSNIKCYICGMTSKSLNGLDRHIKDHHIKPRFSCDLCGKLFLRKQNIGNHMLSFHIDIKFSCNSCPAVFESSAELCDHRLIFHCEYFKCEDCDAAFKKACLLADHVKMMHDGKRWYCHFQDCSTSFSLRSYAKQHFNKFHSLRGSKDIINKYLKTERNDQSKTKCQICGMIAKNWTELNEHFRKSHTSSWRFYCDLCDESFSKKYQIRKHMRIWHMNICCNLCSAEFESRSELYDHKLVVHRKYFKCKDCDAAFGKPCLLSKHIKEMHGGKRWYCHFQDCSSSFYIKRYARKHIQKYHSLQDEVVINKYLKTEKNYQSNPKCQICGIIANSKEDLYVHFKKTHINTLRYSCDLCGLTFLQKNKSDLIGHMHTHQMKKVKFSCKLCPEEFQSNLKLIFHEKNVHNKKFKYEKFDASFVKARDLKVHVKVQHEDKRYNCPVPGCSNSYSLINSARCHLHKYHSLRGEEYRKYSAKLIPRMESEREDDFKCEICEKIFKNRKDLIAHISRVHNKNKSCDVCGKTFSRMGHLINHIHMYHMHLNFGCDLCSLEFRSDKQLRNHKKVAHYKNFKCNQCNMAYVVPSLLKEHVKVKHEGKRYHCSYPGCYSSYSAKSDTAKHLIVAHSLVGENFNKFYEKLTLQ